jgi:hypothetical protein
MENEDIHEIDRTAQAGFIALIALAIQTRDGKNDDFTSDTTLVEAKQLFNRAFKLTE